MSNYNLICEIESANLLKRFLTFSIGTPSRNVTYDNCYGVGGDRFVPDGLDIS